MRPRGTGSRAVSGVRGHMGAYHRTLATLINDLIDGGFALERLEEPVSDGAVCPRKCRASLLVIARRSLKSRGKTASAALSCRPERRLASRGRNGRNHAAEHEPSISRTDRTRGRHAAVRARGCAQRRESRGCGEHVGLSLPSRVPNGHGRNGERDDAAGATEYGCRPARWRLRIGGSHRRVGRLRESTGILPRISRVHANRAGGVSTPIPDGRASRAPASGRWHGIRRRRSTSSTNPHAAYWQCATTVRSSRFQTARAAAGDGSCAARCCRACAKRSGSSTWTPTNPRDSATTAPWS